MKITDLRVNHVVEPMGFQVFPLSFSWRITDSHGALPVVWTLAGELPGYGSPLSQNLQRGILV